MRWSAGLIGSGCERRLVRACGALRACVRVCARSSRTFVSVTIAAAAATRAVRPNLARLPSISTSARGAACAPQAEGDVNCRDVHGQTPLFFAPDGAQRCLRSILSRPIPWTAVTFHRAGISESL